MQQQETTAVLCVDFVKL